MASNLSAKHESLVNALPMTATDNPLLPARRPRPMQPACRGLRPPVSRGSIDLNPYRQANAANEVLRNFQRLADRPALCARIGQSRQNDKPAPPGDIGGTGLKEWRDVRLPSRISDSSFFSQLFHLRFRRVRGGFRSVESFQLFEGQLAVFVGVGFFEMERQRTFADFGEGQHAIMFLS